VESAFPAGRSRGVTVAVEGFFAFVWFGWGQADAPSWLVIPLAVGTVLGALLAVAGVVVAKRSAGPLPAASAPATAAPARTCPACAAPPWSTTSTSSPASQPPDVDYNYLTGTLGRLAVCAASRLVVAPDSDSRRARRPPAARAHRVRGLLPTRVRAGGHRHRRRGAGAELAVLYRLGTASSPLTGSAESAGVPASAERPGPRSHSVAGRPALGWL
jgi:hypothetical protein